MKDLFMAQERLVELSEWLVEEYSKTKNPELLKSIRDCFSLCFKLGRILNGFGKEAD